MAPLRERPPPPLHRGDRKTGQDDDRPRDRRPERREDLPGERGRPSGEEQEDGERVEALRGAFGHGSLLETLLLSLTGVVTSVPLLLFTYGARRIPYSTMGLLQYIAPTLQFLSGVILFSEPFTSHQAVGFSIIWLALIIFSIESYLHNRRPLPVVQPIIPPLE